MSFYESLGFQTTNQYDADDGSMSIVQMKLDNLGLEIFWYKSNEMKEPLELEYANGPNEIGVKHIALRTADIESALRDLQSKGYAGETTEVHVARSLNNSKYLFVKDPDGMWVEFIEDNTDK